MTENWIKSSELEASFSEGQWIWVWSTILKYMECGKLERVKKKLLFASVGRKSACELSQNDLVTLAVLPGEPE